MLQTEYVRSLNCNYERILLDNTPEEKRYQYCILSRGGIKGLLSGGLRYINGQAYLYYDISSRQNVAQMFGTRCINREWMKDFVWNMKRIRQELERFLLDIRNVIWYPEHIYQELENNVFSYLYIPYYEGDSGFVQLIEFWVEHIDYDDEMLVNFVYRMYEQLECNGESYLEGQIFEDVQCLEGRREQEEMPAGGEKTADLQTEAKEAGAPEDTGGMQALLSDEKGQTSKKGIFAILEGKKKKNKKLKDDYRQDMQRVMAGCAAEDTVYEAEEKEYGQTIFIEEDEKEDVTHKLYSAEGNVLACVERPVLTIGKKKGEVDVVINDSSVSRIHANVIMEKEYIYVEDLNSTNGTFKNGLRLQPYEKRVLEEGDEIKCGKVTIVFR